jgi:hypothetical protein
MKIFNSLTSFGQHLRRCHKDHIDDENLGNGNVDNSITTGQVHNQNASFKTPATDMYLDETVNFKDQFRQLLFKVQAKYGYLNVVETGMRDFIDELCTHFARKIEVIIDSLPSSGVAIVKPQLQRLAEELKSVHPLCIEVGSYKKQVEFLKENQNLVVPVEQTSSAFRYEMKVDKVTAKLLQTPVANTYHYVPILETIRSVYKYAHMELNKQPHAAENFMVDFRDGKTFADNAFFRQN